MDILAFSSPFKDRIVVVTAEQYRLLKSIFTEARPPQKAALTVKIGGREIDYRYFFARLPNQGNNSVVLVTQGFCNEATVTAKGFGCLSSLGQFQFLFRYRLCTNRFRKRQAVLSRIERELRWSEIELSANRYQHFFAGPASVDGTGLSSNTFSFP